MLYIPPLWYHVVTALEGSVSINTWTDSKAQALYQEAIMATSEQLKRLHPDVHASSPSYKRAILRSFFPSLIQLAAPAPYQSIQLFLAPLIQARYSALFHRAEMPSKLDPSLCFEEPSSASLSFKIRRQIRELGSVIGERFFGIPKEERIVWLQNYVESMAMWAGTPMEVGAFLNTCFRDDLPVPGRGNE